MAKRTTVDLLDVPAPHSEDLQVKLLGAALSSPECAGRLAETVPVGLLYGRDYELVAGIIRILHEAGTVPNVAMVVDRICDWMADRPDQRDRCLALLDRAVDTIAVAVPEWIDHYAERLRAYADRRFIRDVGLRLAARSLCDEPTGNAVAEALQALSTRYETTGPARVRSLREVLQEVLGEMERTLRHQSRRVVTGFRDLDAVAGSMAPGWLVYLCGRPSSGKTAFALKMALNVARTGAPVLFATLELSETESGRRIIAPEAKWSSNLIRDMPPEYADSIQRQVKQAVDAMPDLPLKFVSKKASVPDLRRDAQHVVSMVGRPLAALVIDRLELLDEMKRDGERYQITTRTSALLAELAKMLDTTVVCLVQVSRKCEDRPDKRPQLSDLRDSGALEQDAMRVISVYRDDVYNPDTKDKGIAEIIVLKNMHGGTGRARVASRMEFPTFDNLAAAAPASRPPAYETVEMAF